MSLGYRNKEATAGCAPAHNGFADRRVAVFATWPCVSYLNIFCTQPKEPPFKLGINSIIALMAISYDIS